MAVEVNAILPVLDLNLKHWRERVQGGMGECSACFTMCTGFGIAVRANSFVGTAQYVSPELLTDKSACKR